MPDLTPTRASREQTLGLLTAMPDSQTEYVLSPIPDNSYAAFCQAGENRLSPDSPARCSARIGKLLNDSDSTSCSRHTLAWLRQGPLWKDYRSCRLLNRYRRVTL